MQTLAEHLTRPLVTGRNASAIPLSHTSARLVKYMQQDTASSTTPEHDAIRFYLLNHGFSALRTKFHPHQPLGTANEVADLYFEELGSATARAFYYLILICSREARHNKATGSFWEKFQGKFGAPITEYHLAIKGTDQGTVVTRLKNNPPSCTLGAYTEALVYAFYKGSYSGGFGGKAWGAVADCLNDFVWGKTTAEMMMDTVWTLCHNNGPIFNKGMLYGHYGDDLTTILDVQRAGQIPQLIADQQKYIGSNLITQHHRNLHEVLVKHFPREMGGHVDWYMVEALGAVKTYPTFKKNQVAKYGSPPGLAEKLAQQKKIQDQKDALALAAQAAAAAAKEAEQKTWFFITENEKAKKLTRAELITA